MTRLFAALTVLLIHTGAASAQQIAADTGLLAVGPPVAPPGATPPPPVAAPPLAAPVPPAVAAPPPAAAPAPIAPPPGPAAGPPPPPVAQPEDGYPPGYGPPPGYVPPPGYGPQRQYGGPGYGASPYYGYPQMAPPPPPRRVTDRPFTLGASVGFGGLKLDRAGQSTSQSGFAYSARLGVGLRPGLILLWDIERSIVNRDASSYSQTAHLGALQMFIGDKLYLKGGFGMAQVNQDDLQFTGWGPALMAGVGLELVQGWNYSLDISSTVTGARYTIGDVDETWINWSLVSFGINFF